MADAVDCADDDDAEAMAEIAVAAVAAVAVAAAVAAAPNAFIHIFWRCVRVRASACMPCSR